MSSETVWPTIDSTWPVSGARHGSCTLLPDWCRNNAIFAFLSHQLHLREQHRSADAAADTRGPSGARHTAAHSPMRHSVTRRPATNQCTTAELAVTESWMVSESDNILSDGDNRPSHERLVPARAANDRDRLYGPFHAN